MTEVKASEYEKKPDAWPLDHFTPGELACRHCHKLLDTPDARRAWRNLDGLRASMGLPLRVHSGYRCRVHNADVGGSKQSYHMRGMAFDVSPINKAEMTRMEYTRWEVQLIYSAGATAFAGIGVYKGFIHLDTRPLTYGVPTVWFDY